MIYLLKPMIFQFATLNNQRVIIKPSLKKLEEVSEILPVKGGSQNIQTPLKPKGLTKLYKTSIQ